MNVRKWEHKGHNDSRRTQRLKYQTMDEEAIIKIILDEAFYIHKTIGPGMLESVYQTCLAHRLRQRNLFVETRKSSSGNL